MSIQLELVLLAVLILLSAFFSGIETGTVSINRFRLDHLVRRRNRKAVFIRKLLDHPDQLLGTTLVGNNIVNTAMPVLATSIAIRLFGEWGPWVSGVFMSVCILILCEYLPKAWFQSHPIKRVLPLAWVMRFFGMLFRPVTITLAWISRHVIPAPQGDGAASKEWLTREHLEYVLSPESGATPTLPDQKRRVIAGILNLAGKPCRALMKPRHRLVPSGTPCAWTRSSPSCAPSRTTSIPSGPRNPAASPASSTPAKSSGAVPGRISSWASASGRRSLWTKPAPPTSSCRACA